MIGKGSIVVSITVFACDAILESALGNCNILIRGACIHDNIPFLLARSLCDFYTLS